MEGGAGKNRFRLAAALMLFPTVPGLSGFGTLPSVTSEGLFFAQPERAAVWTAVTLHIRDEGERLRPLEKKRVTWRMGDLPETVSAPAATWRAWPPFAHGVAHGGRQALQNAVGEATIQFLVKPFPAAQWGLTLSVEKGPDVSFACAATIGPETPQTPFRRMGVVCALAP